ncbi:MAG: hypothetical protein ABJO27_18225 [Pseudoruegeria sp.]
MPAKLLMITRYPVKSDKLSDFASYLAKNSAGKILEALDDDEVLELLTVSDDASFVDYSLADQSVFQAQGSALRGDVRRELVSFVEAPKNTDNLIPDTTYIQLRHVEVKPDQMKAYRQWRDETIFDVVRTNDEVEVFLAYHSVISNQPGVMFISGFSGNVEQYASVFNSDRYKQIVQEAGDQYITGGTDGLYTKIYREHSKIAA